MRRIDGAASWAGTAPAPSAKTSDADDHHYDRQHPPLRPGQRDVAEPGRSERRDREIKRVDIVADRRVLAVLRLVDDCRHHKEKDEEVGSRDDRIVIAPDKREVALHAAGDAIRAKQAKRPKCPKKAEPMPTDRRYERDDHRYVSEAQWVKQIVQAVAAYRQAGEKLAQYEKPNRSVDELKNGPPSTNEVATRKMIVRTSNSRSPYRNRTARPPSPSYSSRNSVPMPLRGLDFVQRERSTMSSGPRAGGPRRPR